jgi:oligopeptidase B
VAQLPGLERHRIDLPEPTYDFSVSGNPEFDTSLLRFSYSSLVTPKTVYDYDMSGRGLEVKKRQEIPSGYDPALYVSERAFAAAGDGARVPISIVRRRDAPLGAGAPLYLYGYGSYGYSLPASFSTARASLLDRGFVFAIAHARGGAEMGRQWYEGGKFLNKKNTFSDFIAVAERLIELGYGRKGEIAAVGRSAGGMLIGAAINMRPDLFRAAIAEVPFVDVLTTMLDETLPLTTAEYEEWGNPADPAFYEYIKSYSPYDNVAKQAYPHVLAVAGFNDPRVTYWEPAKWIARIREQRTNDRETLLFTHLGAGHGGASGRYEALRDVAREYAFLLQIFAK